MDYQVELAQFLFLDRYLDAKAEEFVISGGFLPKLPSPALLWAHINAALTRATYEPLPDSLPWAPLPPRDYAMNTEFYGYALSEPGTPRSSQPDSA